jgi:hypothetical protein
MFLKPKSLKITMSFIKIIKGGFYKYENYRDKDGKVKTRYLGKSSEDEFRKKQIELTKKYKKKKSLVRRIFG